jgi:D-glycero-alpha-D-manno-heptose-7-phosphate kinase
MRISFFGGGTDYPEYFAERHDGAVLGTAINKFAYLSATQFFSRLFDYSIRLAYRQVQCVSSIEEIQHAPFRECLRYCGIDQDIEVDYSAELPSFSGLGSSSTFVVGLLNTLHAFRGLHVSPLDLAYKAIHLEREVLKEAVGCQDQVFAAVGGFNVLEFRRVDDIVVHKVPISTSRKEDLERHLLLLHTGIKRRAEEAASRQVKRIPNNLGRLKSMRELVDEGYEILTGDASLTRFGELLHENWCLKAELDDSITNDTIARMYRTARDAGAIGGKLLGAGGGGFMLFFVPPEARSAVRSSLQEFEEIPVSLNAPGSRIIYG